jgi:excisionase family DNA binding protein
MSESHLQPLTLTIPKALEVSGLGRTKLYELISSGALKSTTIGTRRLIDYASLKALLSGQGGQK